MKISYSYRYGKLSKGIVFFLMFIWCSILAFLPFILTKTGVISTEDNPMEIISIVIIFVMLAIGLGFLGVGIYRVKGCSQVKLILQNGIEAVGAIGELSSKTIYYQGVITTKKVTFYYKGEDGLIGYTTQLISGRLYEALKMLHSREVPIRVFHNRAVVDEDKVLIR